MANRVFGDAGSREALWLGPALAEAYGRSPVLIIVAALAVVMCALAVLALVSRKLRQRALDNECEGAPVSVTPVPQLKAWLELAAEGGDRRQVVERELMRIGRERDNDVRIEDETVHRYHAVIQRTDDVYTLHDVSGASGNGVALNGTRIASAPLSDGDRLELGRAHLVFRCRPA